MPPTNRIQDRIYAALQRQARTPQAKNAAERTRMLQIAAQQIVTRAMQKTEEDQHA